MICTAPSHCISTVVINIAGVEARSRSYTHTPALVMVSAARSSICLPEILESLPMETVRSSAGIFFFAESQRTKPFTIAVITSSVRSALNSGVLTAIPLISVPLLKCIHFSFNIVILLFYYSAVRKNRYGSFSSLISTVFEIILILCLFQLYRHNCNAFIFLRKSQLIIVNGIFKIGFFLI